MTLQASVLSSQLPLEAIFDQQHPQAQILDFPLAPNNDQELQAVARQHLVNRIDDLCDCV
jgi:hypothetical protein